jgi:SAM-dependent methyltransferase
LYTRSVRLYDAIYAAVGKDYAREAEIVHALIQTHKLSPGKRLLDVACGTGKHLVHLQAHYKVEGLDLEPDMLARARERNPDVVLHHGDMLEFELKARYDAVLCLFSAIGYVRTEGNLFRAVENMARHLEPGGVLIIEPWLTPDRYKPGGVHATFVDEPDLKVARMNRSEQDGNLAVMVMHYLVGTPGDISYFTEQHTLGLFPDTVYKGAFEAAGLTVYHDEGGLIGRGLYIGVSAG